MTISLSDAGKRYNRDWIFRHFTYSFETGRSYAITGPNGSGKSTLLQVLSGSMLLNEGGMEIGSGKSEEKSEKSEVKSEKSEVRGQKLEVGGERPEVGSKKPEAEDVISSTSNLKLQTSNPKPSTANSQLQTTNYQLQTINPDTLYRYISICAPYLELIEEMTLTEFLSFHTGFKPFLPGHTPRSVISVLGLEKAADKQIRYYSSGMKQRVKLAQCIFSDTPVVLLDEPCTNLDAAGISLYHQLINDYCTNRMVVVSSNDEVEYSFCKERISVTHYKP